MPDSKKIRVSKTKVKCGSGSGAVYGLGWIGSLIYFIGNANGFWDGVLGVLEAFVWPAILIYHALKFLGV